MISLERRKAQMILTPGNMKKIVYFENVRHDNEL